MTFAKCKCAIRFKHQCLHDFLYPIGLQYYLRNNFFCFVILMHIFNCVILSIKILWNNTSEYWCNHDIQCKRHPGIQSANKLWGLCFYFDILSHISVNFRQIVFKCLGQFLGGIFWYVPTKSEAFKVDRPCT